MVQPLPIPIFQPEPEGDVCCGPPPAPPADPHEKPGYRICRYVSGFVDSGAGPVAKVFTRLDFYDRLGTVLVRLGLGREDYRVSPGLYCAGDPDSRSPVLVTANYKLTFDSLRRHLAGQNVWILVLDTRGVNVWCASAHKTFGTRELLRVIEISGLEKVVSHRRLVVPQLGASGVSGPALKKASGFEVVWGPVRAADLPDFLASSLRVEPAMRKLTFTLTERLLLIPVELTLALKPSIMILAAIFVLSGLGPGFFSFARAWTGWLHFVPAFLAGLLAGAVLAPVLLPWLPFRAFYLKGVVVALPFSVVFVFSGDSSFLAFAQGLFCLAISSYLAMNFTGATPYASPSGVEKEMRRAIPVQALIVVAALVLWLARPFL